MWILFLIWLLFWWLFVCFADSFMESSYYPTTILSLKPFSCKFIFVNGFILLFGLYSLRFILCFSCFVGLHVSFYGNYNHLIFLWNGNKHTNFSLWAFIPSFPSFTYSIIGMALSLYRSVLSQHTFLYCRHACDMIVVTMVTAVTPMVTFCISANHRPGCLQVLFHYGWTPHTPE